MDKPKYPKLTDSQRKNKKISDEDMEIVRQLRDLGMKLKTLAIIYGVKQSTLYHRIDPIKYKESAKKINLRLKQRKVDDPEYRKKHNRQVTDYAKKRSKSDPEFKEYLKQMNKITSLKPEIIERRKIYQRNRVRSPEYLERKKKRDKIRYRKNKKNPEWVEMMKKKERVKYLKNKIKKLKDELIKSDPRSEESIISLDKKV